MKRTFAASLAAAALLLASVALAEKPDAASIELGLNVADFCKKHLGQQVGTGQCGELADHALREFNVHGRPPDSPAEGDYVWGDLALLVEANPKARPDGKTPAPPKYTGGKLADLRPGDIIQFRDCTWAGRLSPRMRYRAARPHHTAVIAAVDPAGQSVDVYEQNYNGKLTVVYSKIKISDLTAGWMRVYHPIAK